MGVLLRHRPVRGPARVAEAGDRRRAPTGELLQLGQRADGPGVVEPATLDQDDPGRVVPAVLQTLEPTDQQVLTRPPADVPDDPAHLVPPPVMPEAGEYCWMGH